MLREKQEGRAGPEDNPPPTTCPASRNADVTIAPPLIVSPGEPEEAPAAGSLARSPERAGARAGAAEVRGPWERWRERGAGPGLGGRPEGAAGPRRGRDYGATGQSRRRTGEGWGVGRESLGGFGRTRSGGEVFWGETGECFRSWRKRI